MPVLLRQFRFEVFEAAVSSSNQQITELAVHTQCRILPHIGPANGSVYYGETDELVPCRLPIAQPVGGEENHCVAWPKRVPDIRPTDTPCHSCAEART